MQKSIIVFTKYPELGKVKTRLADTTGNTTALEIYKRLLKHTEEQLVKANINYVVYWGNYVPTDKSFFSSASAHHLQVDGDLGQKMQAAFKEQFMLGKSSLVGIGCDCYQLESSELTKAFKILETEEVVFGPADDGGYYLIGMNVMHNFLFEDLPWSTESLLDECKQLLKNNNVGYKTIKTLSDVDYFEDLPQIWKDEFRI